jgi:ribosomal protein S18 acetylase RimI-like enzyme
MSDLAPELVPGARYALVFRREGPPPAPAPVPGERFVLAGTPVAVLVLAASLAPVLGRRGVLRAAVKAATARRALYVLLDGRRAVHWGWMLTGRSAWYPVGTRDVVIGPIATDPAARRRGHAARALAHAMRASGAPAFWIHTSPGNAAARAAFARAGFRLVAVQLLPVAATRRRAGGRGSQ